MSEVKSTVLGFPRMGVNRELKKALESYWKGTIQSKELFVEAERLRMLHWNLQKEKGLSVFVVNDFSYYDHMLDLTLALGAIPSRYDALKSEDQLRLYFAMARGEKGNSSSVTAMEMSKWYDTNYHYIVPELSNDLSFSLAPYLKVIHEIKEAQTVLGSSVQIRPVLVGPISYLLLAKTTDGSNVLHFLPSLLDTYCELLNKIAETGVEYVQIDEPHLVHDLSKDEKEAFVVAYQTIAKKSPHIKIFLASYFDHLYENASLVASLPVDTVHIDLVRGDESSIIPIAKTGKNISLGLIDGRNIWKTDLDECIKKAKKIISSYLIDFTISSSCSLLHCPMDSAAETNLDSDIQSWLSFSIQKLEELSLITNALNGKENTVALQKHAKDIQNRIESTKVHKQVVKQRMQNVSDDMSMRKSPFFVRAKVQQEKLQLPLFPTTTIGSFPQTTEIRKTRAMFKKQAISEEEYIKFMQAEIKKVVRFQEEIGLNVLVHGEPERNDMVEYFGDNFDGFVSTKNGWVQSYGSRCVKPPIIYGDLTRENTITVFWTTYAQSLTTLPMKGMLTGPVTILQWSFVRDDQPRKDTAMQIALLIRDEVKDLEEAGIGVIQVDEPALREGLPLRTRDHAEYLKWAVHIFKISTCGVKDETQMHTHMCYSEFNEIIETIAALDADVISIEASRSKMELLEAFKSFKYPNGIGPGVYDIHSPRVPSVEEIVKLMNYARKYVANELLWVNPDCGLKTRAWEEVRLSLEHLVAAATQLR